MFQYNLLSDLHLELTPKKEGYDTFNFPRTAPNLILAGDIGCVVDDQYVTFMKRACEAYTNVYFVLGNHCAYGTNWDDAVKKAKDLDATVKNLHFLHRRTIRLTENLVMMGTTLHSQIPKKSRAIVQACINDFYYIKDWTTNTHNAEHQKSVEWLREETKALKPEDKVMAIFHYPPINKGVSNPIYEKAPDRALNCAFSTDLSSEDWLKRMKQVIFGHTHWSSSQMLTPEGPLIFSNQKGYEGEKTHGFDAEKVYTFNSE